MKTKLLSVTYTDGMVRYAEAVYFDGSNLYSMTVFLEDDYLEERLMYPRINDGYENELMCPSKNEKDTTVQKPCKTVEIDGIIYGQTEYDNGYFVDVENFIVENRHLRYVKSHSDEILAMLESKVKSNEQV